ncbi:MAG: hypothetical protein ACOY82_20855 [Pseudomonadota bacterium]
MSMPRPSFLRSLFTLCLAIATTACSSLSSGDGETSKAEAPTPAQPAEPRPIGGDRDAHGCPVAAGYTWCERERVCVRPWELAREKGFDNTADGFAAYCAAPRTP